MRDQDRVILYLHGFNSSASSHKASVLRHRLAAEPSAPRLWVPSLAIQPKAAIAAAQDLLGDCDTDRTTIVGSSLGGYYATYLAERYACRAVLINPAVRPYDLLRNYLGRNCNPHTGEQYLLTEAHMQELLDFRTAQISHPEHFLVFLQTGDEVVVSYLEHHSNSLS